MGRPFERLGEAIRIRDAAIREVYEDILSVLPEGSDVFVYEDDFRTSWVYLGVSCTHFAELDTTVCRKHDSKLLIASLSHQFRGCPQAVSFIEPLVQKLIDNSDSLDTIHQLLGIQSRSLPIHLRKDK